MKPVPFTYERPGSVEDALSMLRNHGSAAKLLSGGQSLGPMLNMRLARPDVVIDLNDLLELDYVRETEDWVEIGALTRHHRLAHDSQIRRLLPLLSHAAGTIGHYAIRQRGTIGGSLVHADPAAQLPLVAVTLGAEVVLRSAEETRCVPADAFLQNVMTVDIRDEEMVVAVRFPKRPAEGAGGGLRLFSRRHGDFAIVSAAVWLHRDAQGRLDDMRVGLGGVGPVPCRLRDLEQEGLAQELAGDWEDKLASTAGQGLSIEPDPQISPVYRRELAQWLLERALTDALAAAGGAHG